MNEIQNDKEEKNVPYCHKPVGEDRWIRYTKENSLKKNYGKYCHCSHTFKRESKCVLCGDNFNHKHENSPRYCSYRCQSDTAMIAVKVARLKKRTSATTSCPSCGQVFSVAKRGRIRRFCSNKCRQKAHRVVTKSACGKFTTTAFCNNDGGRGEWLRNAVSANLRQLHSVTIKRGGNGAPYLLRRLAKTEPAIVKRYQAGEFASVRAAATKSMWDTSVVNVGHRCCERGTGKQLRGTQCPTFQCLFMVAFKANQ